ncbi:hypothetical protein ANACOL_03159 [Anaerotruncus colihominis DSM 17241]|uniref:Uncharacterized protein n=1 Tax=Anaerotruncus colihominis DSM 17241 TaxID=445972 RepID=B0PDK6_9FIRM|nr:hypothetical protein ANACOL_03159 [Anaerotruncus colihominis DSM 17241]
MRITEAMISSRDNNFSNVGLNWFSKADASSLYNIKRLYNNKRPPHQTVAAFTKTDGIRQPSGVAACRQA